MEADLQSKSQPADATGLTTGFDSPRIPRQEWFRASR
jgi:hypothetical protein